MKKALDDAALNHLFREARSYNRWAAESVSDETLHRLYELLKFGPTSLNTTPARFVFVKSAEAKAKLVACVSPGNLVKVEQAPVTAIIAMDEKFYEKLPALFPNRPGAANMLWRREQLDNTRTKIGTAQYKVQEYGEPKKRYHDVAHARFVEG